MPVPRTLFPVLVGAFLLFVLLDKVLVFLVLLVEFFRRLQLQWIGPDDPQVRAALISTDRVAFVDVLFIHIDGPIAYRTRDHGIIPPEILLLHDRSADWQAAFEAF